MSYYAPSYTITGYKCRCCENFVEKTIKTTSCLSDVCNYISSRCPQKKKCELTCSCCCVKDGFIDYSNPCRDTRRRSSCCPQQPATRCKDVTSCTRCKNVTSCRCCTSSTCKKPDCCCKRKTPSKCMYGCPYGACGSSGFPTAVCCALGTIGALTLTGYMASKQ